MSFTITLPKSSALYKIPLLHPSKKTALAYNALTTVLKHLEAVSHRLHDRILTYSGKPDEDRWLDIQVTIAEVWEMMDAMRRTFRFWPYVQLMADAPTRRLQRNIKDIRDSFQHIDERLEHYFQNVGDSVFGDIYWRYRPMVGKSEEVFTWATGVTLGATDYTKAGVRNNDERFQDHTSVYDFNLIYIRQVPSNRGRKFMPPQHQRIQVSLDEAAAVFNAAIKQLEIQSEHLIKRWEQEQGTTRLLTRGLPPIVIRVHQREDNN